MPHQLEYVVKDAIMLCDKGTDYGYFKPTHNTKVKINKCLVTTTADKIPIVNIPEFKICSITQSPCFPKPTVWENPCGVKVNGEKTLLFRCSMQCGAGGKIQFATSGQVLVPPEDMEELESEFEEEPSWWDKAKDTLSAVANELSWWDAAEMIPFVGGVIGIVRSAMDDPTDWLGIAFSAFSIVLDFAGLLSFGAGNAVSAWVKGGKITAKAAKIANKAGKMVKKANKVLKLTASTGKAFAKALGKTVDKIAKKQGKVCVFACFPAGTPIATKEGYKNIEDIEIGDEVWSYDEKTGQTNLKKVISLIENEADATIKIQIAEEVIETTAEHPFYTKEGWKNAADLTEEDWIKNKIGEWFKIQSSYFEYERKKVYNFEVADLHTYFVGKLMWLVHNAKICLKDVAKAGVKYAKNILNGKLFDKAMRKAYGASNTQIKMANGKFLDVLTDKEIISHKFTQLSEVTFDTAKGYINEIGKKYIGLTDSRKLKNQIQTDYLKQILEIPPQKVKNEQYKKLVEYAWKEKRVKIREISGKTLEEFNKIKDLMY